LLAKNGKTLGFPLGLIALMVRQLLQKETVDPRLVLLRTK